MAPRPRVVIGLLILVAALVTMLNLQGSARPVKAPKRVDAPEELSSATPTWPLAAAIVVVALLVVEEMRTREQSESKGPEIVPVRTHTENYDLTPRIEAPAAPEVPGTPRSTHSRTAALQVFPGPSMSRTASRNASRTTSYSQLMPLSHAPGLSDSDKERALSRALELTRQNQVGLYPQDSEFSSVKDSMAGHVGWHGRNGEMSVTKLGEIEKEMLEDLEISMMTKIGFVANVFHCWHSEAMVIKAVRKLEEKLHLRQGEWEAYMAEERQRFQRTRDELKQRWTLLCKGWGKKVGLVMTKWVYGDLAATYMEAFHAWRALAQHEEEVRRHMRCKERVAKCALRAVCKWMEGNLAGAVHFWLLQWKAQTAKTLAARAADERMKHVSSQFGEKKREWEKLLEDKSRLHADNLNAYRSQEEIRRRKAHEATELMLRKWLLGNSSGLVSTIVFEWKRYVDEMNALRARRQSVHVAIERFLEGDMKGVLHSCLLNWKAYAREQFIHRNEIAERKRKIVQLQEQANSAVSNKEARLLKYARAFGDADQEVLLKMVMYSWRLEAQGLASAELHRQQEIELEERKRMHDLTLTRHRHHLSASLMSMGCKDEMMLKLNSFLAWSQMYQDTRQKWAHSLVTNKSAEKYAAAMLMQFMTHDDQSLLAACFWEFVREIHREIHDRHNEEWRLECDELETSLRRIHGGEIPELQAKLEQANSQAAKIAEHITHVVKSSKEIGNRLREASQKVVRQDEIIASNRRVEVVEEVHTTKRTVRDRRASN